MGSWRYRRLGELRGKVLMVRTVNMHEAKTHLSKLVDEEFIIAKDGRPVARVTPIRDAVRLPKFGFMPDIEVPEDFDEMGREQIRQMFGSV